MSTLSSSTTCYSCPPGKSSTMGAHKCYPCLPGQFTSLSASTQCQNCSLGRYSPVYGSTGCNICPNGTYTTQVGVTAMSACRNNISTPGYFVMNETTQACPRGTYSSLIAQSSCLKCSIGRFGDTEASSNCNACPYGTYGNVEGASVCKTCLQDTRLLCPEWSSIPLVGAGYFRSIEFGLTNISDCTPPEACLEAGNGSTPCAQGYQGYLCNECSLEWFRSGLSCVKCISPALRKFLLVALSIIVLIAVSRVNNATQSFPMAIKISLSWFQFMSLYPTLTSNWPSTLSWVFSFGSIFNFDIGYIGASCEVRTASYYTVSLVKILLPIFILVGVIVLNSLQVLFVAIRKQAFKFMDILNDAAGIFLFILCFFSVQICTSLMSIFNCTFSPVESLFRLKSDPSVVCYDNAWTLSRNIHLFFAVFYYVVIPVGVLLLVRKKDVQKTDLTRLVTQSYKEGAGWFEFFRQYHRLAFLLIRDTFRISLPAKVALYSFLLLASSCIEGEVKPYPIAPENDISQL
jgi:hypothetical protein